MGGRNRPSPPAPSPATGEGGRWHADNVPAARRLRSESTPTETILWSLLRDRRCLGIKFRRQHPVGALVLDFYPEELKVAIEVDGGVHDSPGQHALDEARQQLLEDLAIRFIRVPAHLLNNDRIAVMRFLTEVLSTMKSPPLPSRERGRGEGEISANPNAAPSPREASRDRNILNQGVS